ncbi:hypothetical protein [Halobacillus sp. Marseille-Q1614]|uniref:hypothetical protein n=1 Tax=Halobacillus sp. Marseille-Q1614 TaxID=2709134 RepID=UPI00156F7365|nr:hypothetical protein [Halobacillus sp. Marseille-Q1614]
MNISVFHQEKKIGEIPFASLAAFRLFCEQQGFITYWKNEKKELKLKPALSSINLALSGEEDFLKQMKEFLSNCGITVLEENVEKDVDLTVKFSLRQSSPENIKPRVKITHNLHQNLQSLKLGLYKELKNSEFEYEFIKTTKDWGFPVLEINCVIPEKSAQSRIENLSLHVVSAIMRYFNKGNQSMLSCLPLGTLDLFTKASSFSPSKNKTSTTPPSPKSQSNNHPVSIQKSTVEKQLPTAEVFFDYTIFFSEKKDRLMTHGKLAIKNTSSTPLYNPVICLKVEPAGCLEVKGQILPPDLVDGLGVQSEEGAKGWKFLNKDWLEIASEKGEYWIGPIQRMMIPGRQHLSLDNLQFVIKQPEAGQDVNIYGYVYFNGDKVKFSSNNKISVKFPPK